MHKSYDFDGVSSTLARPKRWCKACGETLPEVHPNYCNADCLTWAIGDARDGERSTELKRLYSLRAALGWGPVPRRYKPRRGGRGKVILAPREVRS